MPLDAVARAVAQDVDGRTVLTTMRSAVPFSLRATTDGLKVVASAFGPLGGDRTRLEVELGSATRLRVGSVAAQVAQPGAREAVSRAAVALTVGCGSELLWQPEPLVVAAGAEHRSTVDVDVDPCGRAVLVETVVLGRAREEPGRYRSRWRVRVGDEPLLSTDLDIGAGAPPGWGGPAVTGGARVLVTALVAGCGQPVGDLAVDGGAVLRLAGPGLLLSWLGTDPLAGARAVGAFLVGVRVETWIVSKPVLQDLGLIGIARDGVY